MTMTTELFRDVRKAAGLKQSELGEYLGLSRVTIGFYERGLNPIPQSVAISMAWLATFGPQDPWVDGWQPQMKGRAGKPGG